MYALSLLVILDYFANCLKICKLYPILKDYEDAWVVRDMLRTSLKNSSTYHKAGKEKQHNEEGTDNASVSGVQPGKRRPTRSRASA